MFLNNYDKFKMLYCSMIFFVDFLNEFEFVLFVFLVIYSKYINKGKESIKR